MPFGYDDALMILGTVLGGTGALGESPQEKTTKEALGQLNANEDWLKSAPFSKEEIMGTLLPMVQKMYRGSADVLAGKAGAAVGDMGLPQGQSTTEYYLQALAPAISQGENLAAGAVSEFGKWFSTIDADTKNRFIDMIKTKLAGAGGLPDMDQFQRVLTGALSGLNLGATAGGNVVSAQALREKTDFLSNLNQIFDTNKSSGGGVEDLLKMMQSGSLKINPNDINQDQMTTS
jgi:hypothetical protein